jgi:hypothetical protein
MAVVVLKWGVLGGAVVGNNGSYKNEENLHCKAKTSEAGTA